MFVSFENYTLILINIVISEKNYILLVSQTNPYPPQQVLMISSKNIIFRKKLPFLRLPFNNYVFSYVLMKLNFLRHGRPDGHFQIRLVCLALSAGTGSDSKAPRTIYILWMAGPSNSVLGWVAGSAAAESHYLRSRRSFCRCPQPSSV